MNINRDNYEIYFLDFHEGKLNENLVDELMLFLELNYDLKEEFDAFDNESIPLVKNVIYPDKDLLKKTSLQAFGSINSDNYQEKLIASIEGDLNDKEKEELIQFIRNNPSVQQEQLLFEKTKIKADSSIVFENKEALKKINIIAFGSVNKENYIEKIITFYEGEATLIDQSDLKSFLNLNPFLQKEFELFAKTIIAPDTEIVFDRKDQLKRTEVPVYKLEPLHAKTNKFNFRKVLYPLSAAASIALVMSIYFALDRNTLIHGNQTARNTDFVINKVVNTDIINKGSYKNNSYQSVKFSADNTAELKNNQNNSSSEKPEYIQSSNYTAIAGPVKQYPKTMESQDTYSELYEIIRERRNTKATDDEPQGKTYSLDQYALYNVKKSLKPKSERNKVHPDDKLSLWDVADAGIRGFNNITGADAKLKHSGNSSFSFALGNRFSVSRSKGEKK